MIFVSLNIRGVGGPLKQNSLRRLISTISPSVILLQETLVSAEKARSFIQKLRPDWLSCAVSAVGTSGGLLASWDPNFFTFDPFLRMGGIILIGKSIEDKKELLILNVYGPCPNRKEFWALVEAAGLLGKKIDFGRRFKSHNFTFRDMGEESNR
jgi:exonuclease III